MHWLSVCLYATQALAVDDSLLWGPYRPNLYFGMRPQIPESLVTGLMWYSTDNLAGLGAIRHECANEDNVAKFGWLEYDPRLGGRQVIQDVEHAVNITTEVVKSADGLSWEVKIKGDQSPGSTVSIIYYAALESANSGTSEVLQLSQKSKRQLTPKGFEGDVHLSGKSKALGGSFKLSISEGTGDHPTHWHDWSLVKPADRTHYTSLAVPADNIWQARDVYLTLIQDQVSRYLEKYGDTEVDVPISSIFSLNNDDSLQGNFHIVQKSFKGPFEFNVAFTPENSEGFGSGTFEERLQKVLDAQLKKFDKVYEPKAPFTSAKYNAFAREMLSNVAGGIGYFYGDSLVADSMGGVETAPPHELFTGTPSRTFFPRGFYWDEGFNLLALMDYDTDLVLQIFNSWFDTMDEDGWIQREQILGPEARARVPSEFQVQDPNIANPPTLVMALAHLSASKDNKDLRELYPKLKKHFEWFRHTQHGEVIAYDRDLPSNEVYRWRGRTPSHILASGLDDYPRAPEPNDGELHVDLEGWVGAMTRSLAQIADLIGMKDDSTYYKKILAGIQENLEKVFWDEKAQAYCDITVDDFEEDAHVCHIGYVTHIPFMLRLVPEQSEAHLLAILDQLRDPEQLWSVGGVRSLSKADPYFGTDENYWRGSVWNNMNYLTLDALRFYAGPDSKSSSRVKERAAEIYRELRLTVTRNIYDQWKETGYVWESYEAVSGAAKGAKAFTGWAGLVANIMAMPETVGSSKSEPKHEDL